jgi:hypothetical protein
VYETSVWAAKIEAWPSQRVRRLMAGSSVRNRSDAVTVWTPRGPVEVVRQQWRSHQPRGKWRWEWLARRRGQRDWRQGTTAHEAIRKAVLLSAGKAPSWLVEAATVAQQELES